MIKNNVFSGLFVGLVFPFACYLAIQGLFLSLKAAGISNGPLSYKESISERTIYLICICGNILGVQFFQRRDQKETIRGIAMMTVLFAMIWAFTYLRELL